MYIITISYTAPLPAIDAALEAHSHWLEKNYQAGYFLVSGPQSPRTGGVIIARGESTNEIERIIAEDPFSRQGLAKHTITRFVPTTTAPSLDLKELK